MKIAFSFLLFSLIWICISCEEPFDTEAPKVAFKTFSPNPRAIEICGEIEDSVFVVKNGEKISFTAKISDNVGLSQYTIGIEDNFGCLHQADKTVNWSVLTMVDMEGTDLTITEELEVPEEVTAGNYYLYFNVIDEAGNESVFDRILADVYHIKVLNDRDTIVPVIALALPMNERIIAARGSSIRIKGELQDNYSLGEGGNGSLRVYLKADEGEDEFEIIINELAEDTGQIYAFDYTYRLVEGLSLGNYHVELVATDGVRNVAQTVEFELEITQ